MPEPHPRTDIDQACGLGRCRLVGADPEQRCRALEQRHVADGLGRREQQQLSGLARERFELPHEALLDATGERQPAREPESARDGRGRQPARQLQERERVAAGLGENAFPDASVERPEQRRIEQRLRGRAFKPIDHELRQPGERLLVRRLAPGEHEPDPLRQQAACHERQRLRGHLIEPLRIVDDAHERLLLGDVGEQAQHGQPDQEAIRRRSGAQTERRAERIALRVRQGVATVQHRPTQRVQARERQLHLGLDTGYARDPAACSGADQILQ